MRTRWRMRPIAVTGRYSASEKCKGRSTRNSLFLYGPSTHLLKLNDAGSKEGKEIIDEVVKSLARKIEQDSS